jgi:hypothetical protein
VCWLLCFKPLIEWPRSESDSDGPIFHHKRAALLGPLLPPFFIIYSFVFSFGLPSCSPCAHRVRKESERPSKLAHTGRGHLDRCNNLVPETEGGQAGAKITCADVNDTSCVWQQIVLELVCTVVRFSSFFFFFFLNCLLSYINTSRLACLLVCWIVFCCL